jgi:hypothetical protein
VTLRKVDSGVVAVAGIIIASLVLGVLVYAIHSGTAAAQLAHLPDSPVEGVVVRIDSESLNDVNEVDILTPNGQKVTLGVGHLENALQFSPSHLAVHMATAQPILAFYRVEGGRPLIYRLEDAPAASPGTNPTPSEPPPSS